MGLPENESPLARKLASRIGCDSKLDFEAFSHTSWAQLLQQPQYPEPWEDLQKDLTTGSTIHSIGILDSRIRGSIFGSSQGSGNNCKDYGPLEAMVKTPFKGII